MSLRARGSVLVGQFAVANLRAFRDRRFRVGSRILVLARDIEFSGKGGEEISAASPFISNCGAIGDPRHQRLWIFEYLLERVISFTFGQQSHFGGNIATCSASVRCFEVSYRDILQRTILRIRIRHCLDIGGRPCTYAGRSGRCVQHACGVLADVRNLESDADVVGRRPPARVVSFNTLHGMARAIRIESLACRRYPMCTQPTARPQYRTAHRSSRTSPFKEPHPPAVLW